MGISKLSWKEIDAWLTRTEHELTLWEITTIRRLSEEYAAEYSQASEKDRPAPHVAATIDRVQIANKIGNVLAMFGKPEPKYEVEE